PRTRRATCWMWGGPGAARNTHREKEKSAPRGDDRDPQQEPARPPVPASDARSLRERHSSSFRRAGSGQPRNAVGGRAVACLKGGLLTAHKEEWAGVYVSTDRSPKCTRYVVTLG